MFFLNKCFCYAGSDGIVCSHNFQESKNVTLLSINDIEVENIFGIDSIDSTHIAVARSNRQQQGIN